MSASTRKERETGFARNPIMIFDFRFMICKKGSIGIRNKIIKIFVGSLEHTA